MDSGPYYAILVAVPTQPRGGGGKVPGGTMGLILAVLVIILVVVLVVQFVL